MRLNINHIARLLAVLVIGGLCITANNRLCAQQRRVIPAQPEAAFIKNEGQYGTLVKGFEHMGPVLYGYEGFNMP
ncbi:MAG: hypothetical protein JNM68_08590, partial [Dinghuibacter sp.]|nr:hypothetical protein [Dinghuibacter sp.]